MNVQSETGYSYVTLHLPLPLYLLLQKLYLSFFYSLATSVRTERSNKMDTHPMESGYEWYGVENRYSTLIISRTSSFFTVSTIRTPWTPVTMYCRPWKQKTRVEVPFGEEFHRNPRQTLYVQWQLLSLLLPEGRKSFWTPEKSLSRSSSSLILPDMNMPRVFR